MLIAARDEQGGGLTDSELLDYVLTLLGAGHDTTAAALGWCFERVLRHPDVLERCRAASVEGDRDYLTAVVNGTLRTRPVADSVARKLSAPLELDGYRIPAGTFVVASIRGVQYSPTIWPDPHGFRPERFLERPAPYTFIPFGGGDRRCIGASFATMEIRTILATVLHGWNCGASDSATKERHASAASPSSPRMAPESSRPQATRTLNPTIERSLTGAACSNELCATFCAVRGTSPAAAIASWFRRGIRSTKRRSARAGEKEPLLLLMLVETLNRLDQQADDAATREGLTETDLAYGVFVADHRNRSLEAAYQANASSTTSPASYGDTSQAGDVHDDEDGQTVFVTVSLSSTVAKRLQAQAGEEASRASITAGRDEEDFIFRRLGQLLEAPYRSRA
jgi:hypothetical protein